MRRLAWVCVLLMGVPTAARAQDAPSTEPPPAAEESLETPSEAPAVEAPPAEPAREAPPEPATEPDAPELLLEPDAVRGPTGTSGALGALTLVSVVGLVTGIGIWVERQDVLAACDRFEAMGDRGCVNYPSIAGQRDVGIGLTIALGTLSVGSALAWILVATQGSAPPRSEASEASVQCVPGVLSLSCAGRF